ncbi:MAG TPA: lipoyl(octanoyl) transferase LipB [Armatimonadota bacterium]|nr:lipoyl(octanoyl) transferase LipB [Armatimonadota bacterium]
MINENHLTAGISLSAPHASRPILDIRCLGVVGYEAALAIQEQIRDRLLRSEGNPTLLLLTHPPTITLGRLSVPEDLIVDEGRIREEGIAVVRANRGGRATYHGPGQLLGYPILDLQRLTEPRSDGGGSAGPSVRKYLRDLEECLIRALRRLGLEGRRMEGATGVWIEDRKIASIGVAVRRWVTLHGFALNVDLDLDAFSVIRPCGFPASVMTSIRKEGGRVPPWIELEQIVSVEFARVFGLHPASEPQSGRVSPKLALSDTRPR